jgi:hypothetical protein
MKKRERIEALEKRVAEQDRQIAELRVAHNALDQTIASVLFGIGAQFGKHPERKEPPAPPPVADNPAEVVPVMPGAWKWVHGEFSYMLEGPNGRIYGRVKDEGDDGISAERGMAGGPVEVYPLGKESWSSVLEAARGLTRDILRLVGHVEGQEGCTVDWSAFGEVKAEAMAPEWRWVDVSMVAGHPCVELRNMERSVFRVLKNQHTYFLQQYAENRWVDRWHTQNPKSALEVAQRDAYAIGVDRSVFLSLGWPVQ